MTSLSTQLREVIGKRIQQASAREVLSIASALCAEETDAIPVESPYPFQPITPKERFETRGDVVLDHRTGLMWPRETLAGGRMKWAEAKAATQKCDIGGYSDWHLPTIRELLSLVDYERHDPSINTDVFKCEAAWYWSSTPLASSPGDCAWGVGFNGGVAYWGYQGYDGFVRPCRAGESVEHWF